MSCWVSPRHTDLTGAATDRSPLFPPCRTWGMHAGQDPYQTKSAKKQNQNLSSGFVVVQIHKGPPDLHVLLVANRRAAVVLWGLLARLPLGEAVLPGVHEGPGKARPEMDIVRASSPLESLRRRPSHRPVASAIVQLSGGAGPGEGMGHSGGGYRVHKRRLAGTWWCLRKENTFLINHLRAPVLLTPYKDEEGRENERKGKDKQ